MGVGRDRAEIVDPHRHDVVALRLVERPQHQPADAAESIDRNPNSHRFLRMNVV
jgi:hypothetical protein